MISSHQKGKAAHTHKELEIHCENKEKMGQISDSRIIAISKSRQQRF